MAELDIPLSQIDLINEGSANSVTSPSSENTSPNMSGNNATHEMDPDEEGTAYEPEKTEAQEEADFEKFQQLPWWRWLEGWKEYKEEGTSSFLLKLRHLTTIFLYICANVILGSAIMICFIIASSYFPWSGNESSVTNYMNRWTCTCYFIFVILCVTFQTIPILEITLGFERTKAVRNKMITFTLVVNLLMILYMLTLAALQINWWYYGLEFIGGWGSYVVVIYGLALYCRKFSSKRRFAEYFLVANAFMAVIAFLYSFILIPFYRGASLTEKYLIRLLVHPLIFALGEVIWRYCVVQFGTPNDQTAHYDMFIIKISNAVYARMFIVSFGNLQNAAQVLVLSLIADLTVKITYRLRERLANNIIGRLTNGKLKINGPLYHRNLLVLANLYWMESFCELIMVVLTPFLFWAYSKDNLQFDFIYALNGVSHSLSKPLLNGLINLGFELISQFVGLILILLQGIPLLSTLHWRKWNSHDTIVRLVMLFCCFPIFIYIYRTWPFFVICESDNACTCDFPQHKQICEQYGYSFSYN